MDYETTEEVKKLAFERRRRALAAAFINRAHEAGIPRRHMRINQATFAKMLSPAYHKNPEKLAEFVYKRPNELLNLDTIIIDGGGVEDRKRAGFALLFRIITVDHYGMYKDFKSIAHRFSTWNKVAGETREELTEELKDSEVLFISDFKEGVINPHTDGSFYFDEVFSARIDSEQLTIVSFADQISGDKAIRDMNNGQYFANWSAKKYADSGYDEAGIWVEGKKRNPYNRILRIRVKRAL
jgi:hypothetical protein